MGKVGKDWIAVRMGSRYKDAEEWTVGGEGGQRAD